jgi:multisubunit Na+/H+ antiporter MnhB subunit
MNATDLVLAGATIALAAAALFARELRAAAILFIAFGLLLALAWARLGAADVALAEAAIGAGVTGALLIDAAAQLAGGAPAQPAGRLARFAVGTLSITLAVALAHATLALPPSEGAAARLAAQSLATAEIAHPVTAVLLAFRAYDTLLEIAVLLIAVIAAQTAPPVPRAPLAPDPVLARVAGVTVPLAVLVAVYLLWAGATRTGGAFQGGAVLAGALLLARFAQLRFDPVRTAAARRVVLAAGLAVFIAVGLAAGAVAGAVLAYPRGSTGALVLAIETALMVSIAASLLALFGLSERR